MKTQTTFYNTIGLEGKQLEDAIASSANQEVLVLGIFRQYPQYQFRAYDIEVLMNGRLEKTNHDGIKRSITNLTGRGLLIKSERAIAKGPYGKKVHVWQLAAKGD